MIDRLLSTVVAIGLAVLVWLYARSRNQETLDNIPVPVDVTIAAGQADRYDLEVNGPSHVPVTFRGPPSCTRALRRMLERGEIRVAATVVVPEERQNDSHFRDTVRIDAADVQGPPGVTPTVLEGRNRIPVTLYRVVERRLPVRLDPPPDERVTQVTVEPARVRVRGPQDIIDRLRAIPTHPLLMPAGADNEGSSDSVAAEGVPLAHEIDGRPIRCTPAAVTVRMAVRPRQKLYELANLPVRFLCPADFDLRPEFLDADGGKLMLKVWGPVADRTPSVVAYVDLTGRAWQPGVYPGEPIRFQLPNEYQVADSAPRAPAFRLAPFRDTRGQAP
jgi:YbbR-like protein